QLVLRRFDSGERCFRAAHRIKVGAAGNVVFYVREVPGRLRAIGGKVVTRLRQRIPELLQRVVCISFDLGQLRLQGRDVRFQLLNRLIGRGVYVDSFGQIIQTGEQSIVLAALWPLLDRLAKSVKRGLQWREPIRRELARTPGAN